ncbi:YihY/virulence factor BrkB family protein [Aliarcobacter lanthieri]|uniref:YihY/virulence factor BrkB family protein n=1 Tax=Aliarcobacter lanthieri TaxID=1355374 RepID=UPI001A91D027|nr:YihY/virulence factor BrkB family protein [Aliarcobacter lanthieri]
MQEKTIFRKIIDSIESFFNDDTNYFAASLSFFTIFSILPIIALGIAIISKFPEFDAYLDTFTNFLLNFLNPTHSEEIISTLKNYISNSNKLGFIGIFYMLFVYIMFFKDYDYIVNKIHNAKRRAIYKSFFIYTIFFIVFPAIFIFLNTLLSLYSSSLFKNFLFFLFTWSIFFLLFKLSVNKKISSKSAMISSFITLSVLSITKNLFVYYVVYNKTYSTIYGSLSTLLFSFLWIYISWIIYLYGVKFCHRLNTKESNKII